jgi:hypothetical protein
MRRCSRDIPVTLLISSTSSSFEPICFQSLSKNSSLFGAKSSCSVLECCQHQSWNFGCFLTEIGNMKTFKAKTVETSPEESNQIP